MNNTKETKRIYVITIKGDTENFQEVESLVLLETMTKQLERIFGKDKVVVTPKEVPCDYDTRES